MTPPERHLQAAGPQFRSATWAKWLGTAAATFLLI